MTIAQSHALLLKEMCRLHIHLTDKLTAQFEHIEIISIDLLVFKMDVEYDFTSFHDKFQTMEANIQEIIDILKMREEADEFEMVA